MSRPALHDPFLAWEGELDDVRVRIVFVEFYENETDENDLRVCWNIIIETYIGVRDAMGKEIWHEDAGLTTGGRCLVFALVDALGKRPDWAKDPD